MASWRQRLIGRGPHLTHIAFVLVAAMLMAGCGEGNTSGPGSTAAQPTNTASPAATTTSSPAASSVHATTGRVTLTMSKSRYGTEDPLIVTISNGLNQVIWIQTTPASCLGLVLQRQISSSWEVAGGCASARAAQPTAISAGSALVKRLDYTQGADSGAGWPAGTYRVMLAYSVSQSATSSAATTAYSPVFDIA